MNSSKLLGVMIVLQGLILLGQWTGGPAVSAAHADTQLPNPSERQIAILDEIKSTNSKLDHLLSLLQSGEVKVEVTKVDRK